MSVLFLFANGIATHSAKRIAKNPYIVKGSNQMFDNQTSDTLEKLGVSRFQSHWWQNGMPSIVGKKSQFTDNHKANKIGKPTFLSWCGKIEGFQPADSIKVELLINKYLIYFPVSRIVLTMALNAWSKISALFSTNSLEVLLPVPAPLDHSSAKSIMRIITSFSILITSWLNYTTKKGSPEFTLGA